MPYEHADRYDDRVHYVVPDIKPYQSPSSLQWIEGRRQRRLDLKATGCREVDPGEKKEFFKRREQAPIKVNEDELRARHGEMENMSDHDVYQSIENRMRGR